MKTWSSLAYNIAVPFVCFWLGVVIASHGADDVPSIANETHQLRFRLALANDSDFRRNHRLSSGVDDCRADGDAYRCAAFTEAGAPVSYHCDKDGCSIDCGASK